jgi:adenylate kinase
MATHPFEVVYLTGAPAAGKSTVSRALQERVSPLVIFEYGERLTQYLSHQDESLTQDQIRSRSARVVRPEDVQAVDRELLEFVAAERTRSHVLVDSHAVTKEGYGFRITAFHIDGIRRLAPTRICMLYTPPEVAMRRIEENAAGRPTITAWEAQFHTDLQASVAATYAVGLGVPMYLIDSSAPLDTVVAHLARHFDQPVAPAAGGA